MNENSKYENITINNKRDSELFCNIHTSKASEIYIWGEGGGGSDPLIYSKDYHKKCYRPGLQLQNHLLHIKC